MISRIFVVIFGLSHSQNVSNVSSAGGIENTYNSSHQNWTSYNYTPNLTVVDGVPVDLISFIPSPFSPDYGKYPECELPRGSGLMSGICVPSLYVSSDLPYCGEFVDYPVCVPGRNPMWSHWNWTTKDSVVRDQVLRVVQDRKSAEELSLANNGTSDEYLSIRFYGNDPCVSMYKRIVCYYNFPRCQDSVGPSLGSSPTFPICTERCLDFFNTCKYGKDFAANVCEIAGSFWPLNADDLVNGTAVLNVSATSMQMLSQSSGTCTGMSS